MSEILDTAVALPTGIYTIAFGICLVYWVFVMLGALDIDTFDGIDGGSDGLDFDAGDGDVGDAGDVGDGADSGDGHGKGVFGALSALGLGRVPLTVALSAVLFFSWGASLMLSAYATGLFGGGSWWIVAPAIFAISLALGTVAAAFAVRPLIPVFEIESAKSRWDYIGAMCDVTTGRVDGEFGQATLEDGGTVLVIPVRCDANADKLGRGSQALGIDYDEQREAYVVEPCDPALGGT